MENHLHAQTLWPLAMTLGESVRWFDHQLTWVDIAKHRRYRWDLSSEGPHADSSVEDLVLTLPGSHGTVLVGHNSVRIDGSPEAVRVELGPSDARLNDARADAAGRLWVGSLTREEPRRRAQLWRIDDRGCVSIRRGLQLSNGLGFSPDGRFIYHADTFAHTVFRGQLESLSGEVTDWQVFASWQDELPDGLCVDAEGGVWVALWGSARIERWSDRGARTHVVHTGARQPTSVAFGGADLSTLYIASAAEGLSVMTPQDGAILAADVGMTGLPEAPVGPWLAPMTVVGDF